MQCVKKSVLVPYSAAEMFELVGAGIFLASEAAGFVNGEILTVDGGFLASGVNQ